jgi:hypothetical protein
MKLPNFLQTIKSRLGSLSQALSPYPTYSVDADGVTIDFQWQNVSDPSKKYIVKIGFNELDEVQTFKIVDSKSFMLFDKLGLGLNERMKLMTQGTTDLYKYNTGEITRPSVYIFTQGSEIRHLRGSKTIDWTPGTLVFLRGPDIFYFLEFVTSDVSDLVNAFNSYKSKKGAV